VDLTLKLVYTRAEAAERLAISISSLDMLIATGRLKAIRKGRRVTIHKSEIERMALKEIPQIWPPRDRRKPAATSSPQLTLQP
jgi:excisionase family DNA binding protein